METFNPHELPELPYDFSDLEPVISGEIMELHYTKHHKTYVTKLNQALEQYYDAQKVMDLEKQIALQNAIQFNGGGHINHSIFWTVLAPEGNGGGGQPGGDLAGAINQAFGSFDAFVEKFSAATVAVQGSGWGWLGWCPVDKKLKIATCANQDPLSTKGLVPLFGVDVWEHAYYLQYKNVRPDYVKNIWRIANWKEVEKRFSECKGA